MQNSSQVPPGFVYDPIDMLFENPATGEWINPDDGQIYSNQASSPDAGAPGSGVDPGSVGSGAGVATIADKIWGSSPAAVPASEATMTPAVQPALSATEEALGLGPAAPTSGLPMTPASAVPGLLDAAPGSVGAGYLPYAGVAAGAYTGYQQAKGALDVLKNKRMSPISQAALAVPTGGASVLYNPVRKFFGGDGDKYKTESRRLGGLQKGGVYIPDNLMAEMPKKGRSFESMMNRNVDENYVGYDNDGRWTNNKFNMSRNVDDLRAEDIVNYATFAEQDPNWFNTDMDKRLKIAQKALDAKAVSEGKGSINVDWKKVNAGGDWNSIPSKTDIKPVMKDPPRDTKPKSPIVGTHEIPRSTPAAVKPTPTRAIGRPGLVNTMVPKQQPRNSFAFIPRFR